MRTIKSMHGVSLLTTKPRWMASWYYYYYYLDEVVVVMIVGWLLFTAGYCVPLTYANMIGLLVVNY